MATIGRPREFDVDQALDHALEVFWRNGYEGASVAELTHAMGINPPSLYAAFGNKEGLFRKVLDRYVAQRTRFWQHALEAPTTRGFASILAAGLDEQPAADILAVPEDFYTELGLAALISPLRLRGMSAMLARIKRRLRETG